MACYDSRRSIPDAALGAAAHTNVRGWHGIGSSPVEMPSVWIRHLVVPAVAPVTIVLLYLTPVGVFGCVNRGLTAIAIGLAAALAAAVTTAIGVKARARHDADYLRWMLSSLTLLLGVALLVGLR